MYDFGKSLNDKSLKEKKLSYKQMGIQLLKHFQMLNKQNSLIDRQDNPNNTLFSLAQLCNPFIDILYL